MVTLPAHSSVHFPATLGAATARLLAASAAFDAVFGIFLVATVVLAVVTLRWAIRRDRVGRAEWVRRQTTERDVRTGAPAPKMNGHAPRATGSKGTRGGQNPGAR